MGECYDQEALWPLRQEIMDCMSDYKGCYQRAYRCLGAAAEIMEDQRAVLLTDTLLRKLAKRARGILSREVPRRKEERHGLVKQRFLGAVTHEGAMCLYNTAAVQCEKIYALTDHYSLAHELLIHLLAGITGKGYDVVACPDPMAPERLAHLLVPQLGLAFLSTAGTLPKGITPYRRVRLDTAAEGDVLRRGRPRLRFARKVSAALTEEAVSSLGQAKAMHDELESVYNPHVDFDLVDRMARGIWEEIQTF